MKGTISLLFLLACVLSSEETPGLYPWGLPNLTGQKLKVLHYRAFDCGYLPRIKISLWVTYRYYRTPKVKLPRYRGRFMPDTFRLKKAEAAFPAVYESVPKFIHHPLDKGHLAPDAALKAFGTEAQKETYFLPNIIPQFANTNRFIWAALEKSIRDWAGVKETLWVTVGPVFYPRRDTFWLGTHNIAIPHACFCLVMRRPAQFLAFIVPNDSLRRTGQQLPLFLVSVDSVERLTGIDFFPALPASLKAKQEALIPAKVWTSTP
ncbi:MAG: DNA/RNA non-specific endonuclease [bacterium]